MILEMAVFGGAVYTSNKYFKRGRPRKKLVGLLQTHEQRDPALLHSAMARPAVIPLTTRLTIGGLMAESQAMRREFLAGKARVRSATTRQTMSILDFTRYAVKAWVPQWRSAVIIIPSLLAFKLYQTAFAMSLHTLVNGIIGVTSAGSIIWVLTKLAIGFPLVAGAFIIGQRLVSIASSDILNSLRRQMFVHLQELSISFYKGNTTGNVISRFSSDIDQIEKGLTRKAMDGLIAVMAIGINVTMLFVVDWRLSLLTVTVLPLTNLLLKDIVPWAKGSMYRQQKEKANVVNLVQENFTTQAAVKGYGYQQSMITLFDKQLDDLHTNNVEALFSNSLVESTSLISLLFTQLLVTCGGSILALQGFVTPGALVAYLSLLTVLHRELYDVAKRVFPNIVAAAGTIQRVEDLLREMPQVQDAPGAITMPILQEEIRLDDVNFSYNGIENQLNGLSLMIPAGQYVAIVGSSGAGKSTLLSLLLRFYDVGDGSITIDGNDVRELTQDSLRAQMGIVFQDPLLLNGSIRNNIRMSKPDASDAEIEVAARAAEIHDFIQTLPDGYDTLVGERGGRLSGGQQQRISIARAVLRDPAILMLDEATSVARRRSVIFVTHRLRSITNADCIYVLDQGQLAEQGTHDELLTSQGVYQRLWQTQEIQQDATYA